MSDRFEREIDEIIDKAGDLQPRLPLRQHFKDAQQRFKEQFAGEVARMAQWITPGKVGLLGAVALLGGLIARMPYVMVLGVGALLVAYLISVIRGTTTFQQMTGYDRSWRGRPMDVPEDREGLRERFRRWFGKRKGR